MALSLMTQVSWAKVSHKTEMSSIRQESIIIQQKHKWVIYK